MNKFIYCVLFILPMNIFAQIGIGTTSPHTSSILDVYSTNKGFLPPRMEYNDIIAIQTPAQGLLVYCTNCCGSGTGTIAIRKSTEWDFINKDDPSCTFIADAPMFTDFDLDGVPNTTDQDIDGDGIPNALEAPVLLLSNESNGTFGSTTAGAPKDVETNVSGYSFSPNGETAGKYAVISKNSEWHKFDLWDYTGHTDGSGEDAFLAVNGGSAIGTFYEQSIPMIPNVPYTFSFWSRGDSYTIQGRVANASNPSKVLASETQSTGGTIGSWTETTFTFTNTSSKVELFTYSIANLSTSALGNDFAIDDITAGPTNPGNIKLYDYDQDGLSNEYDLDSDGDGIPDNVEYQPTLTYVAPGTNTDVDGSGLLTAYGSGLSSPVNSDGDALYDFLDADSDNDGIEDKNETGLTLTGQDVDNDGLDDGADSDISSSAGVGGNVVDVSDNVSLPGANPGDGDYRFIDFDGDGVLDAADNDFDNDGIPNSVEQSASLLNAENNGAFTGNTTTPVDVQGDITGYSYATSGTAEGTYAVINKDIQWHPSNLWNYTGHTDGSNTDPFLAVNGGNAVGVFYNQMVSLIPNIQYTFSFWGRGDAFTIESRLINNNDISNTPVAKARLSTPNTIGWTQKTFTYVNQTGDIATFRFEIGNLSTGGGNDFAIDDVSAFPTDPSITISLDHDLDGIPNEYDSDSDGDGIPDNVEAQTTLGYIEPLGTYTNGIDDAYGTGLMTLVNTDGDSYPDYIDTDSDNDGESDKLESGLTFTGVDSDKDGIDDGADGEVPGRGDANGLAMTGTTNNLSGAGAEKLYRLKDYDGDLVNDDIDLDLDNDGILNVDEASASLFTHESNGTFGTTSTPVDMVTDVTGGYTFATNGLAGGSYAVVSKDCSWHTGNLWDFVGNTDGSNTDAFLAVNGHTFVGAFYRQVITLYPGIEYTFKFYSRGSSYGLNGHLYLDADRVNSVVNEAGSTSSSAWTETSFTYTNPNTVPQKYLFQIVNSSTGSSGNDFAIDDISAAPTDPSIIVMHDSDGDGISNEYDLDSDNDGIPDNVEYQTTTGYIAPGANTAVDANGVLLAYSGGLKNPVNTDGDSYYDYLDLNSDNDEVDDKYETGFTLTGIDSDKDGLDDGADDQITGVHDVNGSAINASNTNILSGAGPEKDYRFVDFDGDLVQDNVDEDIDNDGILNINEGISNLLVNEFNGTFGTTSSPLPVSSEVLNYNFATDGQAGGTYAVISKDCSWHSLNLWNFVGHTDGSNTDAFLAVNGHNVVGTFYSQWIILPPGVEFEFSYWSRGSSYGLNSRLFTENDMVVSVLNEVGATGSSWTQSTYTFTNTSNQKQRYLFDIVNSSTGASGNDFAIDDIAIKPTDPSQLIALDTDGDGLTNVYDLDSDGDGIPDNVEYQTTAGYSAPGTTVDAQGRLVAYGNTGLTTAIDFDTDGVLDYLDTDSDNDFILDKNETGFTLTGVDSDRDGLDDGADESVPGYGDYNGLAINSGGTNILTDAIGGSGSKAYRFADFDNDGIENNVDEDRDNDGILNIHETKSTVFYKESNGTFGTTSAPKDFDDMVLTDYTYSSSLPGTATYSIISQANYFGSSLWNFAGHTDGTNTDAFLIVKGETVVNKVFYHEVVAIPPNAEYQFEYYYRGHRYRVISRLVNVSDGSVAKSLEVGYDETTSVWTKSSMSYANTTNQTKYFRFELVNGKVDTHPNDNRMAIDDIKVITSKQSFDYDGDGLPNDTDLDSDGDGIPDNLEYQITGSYSQPGTTVDANGIWDNYTATGLTTNVDTDGDGFPDYIDNDSDNDGVLDLLESGILLSGIDSDNDGIDDGADENVPGYGDINGKAYNADGVNVLIPDPNGGTDKAYREAAFSTVTQIWTSTYPSITDINGFNPIDEEWFGSDIAMSANGNVAVVGASKSDFTNSGTKFESGSAYLLRNNGTNWIGELRINSGDPQQADRFGNFVAISGDGNTVAIGVPEDDHGDGTSGGSLADRGSVYIYKYNGSWSQVIRLYSSDANANDLFGTSISLSDDGLSFVAGAPGNDAAYYFTLDGGSWSEVQKITGSDVTGGDKFGTSTDISGNGNTIIVGSPEDDHDLNSVAGSSSNRGSAYVFQKNGSTFNEQKQVYAQDALVNDKFGYDVALSSDGLRIVVGSPEDDHDQNSAGGSLSNRGSAYVFDFNGSEWLSIQQLFNPASRQDDNFGNNITMSGDGSTIAVGIYLDDIQTGSGGGSTSNRGTTILYRYDGTMWNTMKTFNSADASQDDMFGSGVGINSDGTKIIIGAKQNNPSGNGDANGDGSIYIIE